MTLTNTPSNLVNLAPLGYSKYFITEYGEIYSVTTNREPGKLKPFIDRGGYENYSLWGDDGVRRTVRSHRLVAMMFIPNPYNLPQVNHKDKNPHNNHVSNLEWVTNSENQRHAVINCREHRVATMYEVHYICRLLQAGYPEQKVAEIVGISPYTVFDILYGRSYTKISQQYCFPKRSKDVRNRPQYPEVAKYVEPALPRNAPGLVRPMGRPCHLPEDQVRVICDYLEAHWSDIDIAKELNVSPNTVARIRARLQYDEVTQDYSF